jgi:hypothetical protein
MPEMKIKPLFSLGQTVWLSTDDEQFERLIVGIIVAFNGFTYLVRYSDEPATEHFANEILDKKRTS